MAEFPQVQALCICIIFCYNNNCLSYRFTTIATHLHVFKFAMSFFRFGSQFRRNRHCKANMKHKQVQVKGATHTRTSNLLIARQATKPIDQPSSPIQRTVERHIHDVVN